MLRNGFSILVLLIFVFLFQPSDTFAKDVLSVVDNAQPDTPIELPEVTDYPYKTALFEYFSGKYPSFDELLKDDSYLYLSETGDDNLALMAELSPRYRVYMGNLYQMFFVASSDEDDVVVEVPAAVSVLSLLKGQNHQSSPETSEAARGEADVDDREDVLGSLWLLDKLYTHSFYSDLLRISKKELLRSDTSGAAAYFRGITSLALNSASDALKEFKAVERSSGLYPYARVASAQALFDKGDLSGAEMELKALLIGTNMDGELAEKVRLMLGQVYFEEDLFNEALLEFMNIPQSSPYYREAVIGTSWALIKNGTFDTAVDMLKELKPDPPYSSLEWEALVMLGYGYMQLDRHAKALKLFERLLSDVTLAGSSLDKMRTDPSASDRYLDYLLTGDVEGGSDDPQTATDDPQTALKSELMYFDLLKGDGVSKILLQEYAVMQRLRGAILSRRADIAERRLYFENMNSGMQSLFSLVDMETRLVKTILTNIDRRVDPDKDPRNNINKLNLDFFNDVETGLYAHWVKIKKREINENEKEVVRLLLYELGESLDCVKTSLICTIVDMADNEELSIDKLLELSDIMDILEAIAKDIESVRGGGLIEYEKSIEDLRKIVVAKRKAAQAGIDQLDVMDLRLRRFIDETDITMRRRLLAVVKGQMKVGVKNFKDELTDLRAHIMTGLISSQKAVEESRANER